VNYVFDSPDKVMVGTRGQVGNRLFLLQVRQGRRLLIIKCEKQQLEALASWVGQIIDELGRPGHLEDDFTLEPEFDPDFSVGDITLSINEETRRLVVFFDSVDDADTLEISLTQEWAGGLAIAIQRLVDQGRPLCPLCGGPLDPRGHDCPRTNGFRPPIR
jgi:uncharacterized repeat protein (TIGR03847 family)